MADRIQKFLQKLPKRQRKQIEHLIELVVNGQIAGLDIKKPQGKNNIYRVRKGDIRIIYHISGNEIIIIAIERRGDTTYNKF